MTTQVRNPRLATMIHQATPYRGEWIIVQDADRHYIAKHEVKQAQGDRKLVERIPLNSLAEAQAFSIYLSSHGWSHQWPV
jgi:hypothetical protein